MAMRGCLRMPLERAVLSVSSLQREPALGETECMNEYHSLISVIIVELRWPIDVYIARPKLYTYSLR